MGGLLKKMYVFNKTKQQAVCYQQDAGMLKWMQVEEILATNLDNVNKTS